MEEREIERIEKEAHNQDFNPPLTIAGRIRQVLHVQAAAEQRSFGLQRYLTADRALTLTFSYCTPYSLYLQSLSFTIIEHNLLIRRLDDIEHVCATLESMEHQQFGNVLETDRRLARRRGCLAEIAAAVQDWPEVKQQTAFSLLKLLCRLHPVFNPEPFDLGSEHRFSLHASSAPIHMIAW